MLIIIPINVQDLLLKVCEGKSSRVKKISEQSVAETAVRMLEADTLEVPSAASEKYRISAMESGRRGEKRREENRREEMYSKIQ